MLEANIVPNNKLESKRIQTNNVRIKSLLNLLTPNVKIAQHNISICLLNTSNIGSPSRFWKRMSLEV